MDKNLNAVYMNGVVDYVVNVNGENETWLKVNEHLFRLKTDKVAEANIVKGTRLAVNGELVNDQKGVAINVLQVILMR